MEFDQIRLDGRRGCCIPNLKLLARARGRERLLVSSTTYLRISAAAKCSQEDHTNANLRRATLLTMVTFGKLPARAWYSYSQGSYSKTPAVQWDGNLSPPRSLQTPVSFRASDKKIVQDNTLASGLAAIHLALSV